MKLSTPGFQDEPCANCPLRMALNCLRGWGVAVSSASVAAGQKVESDGRAQPRCQKSFPKMLWGRMVVITCSFLQLPSGHGSVIGRVSTAEGHREPKRIDQTSGKHILPKHLVIFVLRCPKPVVNVTSRIPLKIEFFGAWARSLQSYM